MENRLILGSSPQAQLLQKLIAQAATSGSPVLLCGEEGTGREFFARLLHEQSGKGGTFATLNCSGLTETVLSAETQRKTATGKDGVLYLDNLDEVPVHLQGRVAQAAEAAGVRLVAATTLGPSDARLAANVFGIHISVPALRDRKSDIPVLIDHFIKYFAQKHAKGIRGIDAATLRKLTSYRWPGNIQELQDAVERAVKGASREMLGLEDFAFLITADEERPLQFMIPGATIHEIEKEAILRTLEHAGGSTTAAARILKMSVRKIQYKLKQYRTVDGGVPVRTKAKGASGL